MFNSIKKFMVYAGFALSLVLNLVVYSAVIYSLLTGDLFENFQELFYEYGGNILRIFMHEQSPWLAPFSFLAVSFVGFSWFLSFKHCLFHTGLAARPAWLFFFLYPPTMSLTELVYVYKHSVRVDQLTGAAEHTGIGEPAEGMVTIGLAVGRLKKRYIVIAATALIWLSCAIFGAPDSIQQALFGERHVIYLAILVICTMLAADCAENPALPSKYFWSFIFAFHLTFIWVTYFYEYVVPRLVKEGREGKLGPDSGSPNPIVWLWRSRLFQNGLVIGTFWTLLAVLPLIIY
ncbi:MAG: hypothetical protein K8963_10420 [Proteobacteria bacterium]|nr:hypothetical protein [Pseudomonadota bacterium]